MTRRTLAFSPLPTNRLLPDPPPPLKGGGGGRAPLGLISTHDLPDLAGPCRTLISKVRQTAEPALSWINATAIIHAQTDKAVRNGFGRLTPHQEASRIADLRELFAEGGARLRMDGKQAVAIVGIHELEYDLPRGSYRL